jgi:hypothetical protein
MYVSGRPSVTPLHSVVDVHNTPEKYQFIPEGVPIVSRESIMKVREQREADPSLGKFEWEQAAVDWDQERRRRGRLLKKATLLTHLAPARQDAPFRGQGRSEGLPTPYTSLKGSGQGWPLLRASMILPS